MKGKLFLLAIGLSCWAVLCPEAIALLPIPEPGLVVQGNVLGMVETNRPRIVWQARRGNETALAESKMSVVSGGVRHFADFQFETLLPGSLPTPGKLALTDTTNTYQLSVTINGLDYPLPASVNQFMFRFADRGRPDAVNLDLARRLPSDTFETWSLRVFGRVVPAAGDEDGDGRRNDLEFASGTSPIDAASFPTNRPPVASLATNRFVAAELATLTVTNVAIDPDLPFNRLTWRIVSGPSNAFIGTNSGLWTWTPSSVQASSTNAVVVAVDDDGIPVLSSTNQFTVIVSNVGLGGPKFDPPIVADGLLRLRLRGSGRLRVESSGDLIHWSAVNEQILAPDVPLDISIAINPISSRFFRLVALP